MVNIFYLRTRLRLEQRYGIDQNRRIRDQCRRLTKRCQCSPGAHACLENRLGLDIDGRRQVWQVVIWFGRVKTHMSKIIIFFDIRLSLCRLPRQKGGGPNTSFLTQYAPPRGWLPPNGNGLRWTWRTKFLVEIRSDRLTAVRALNLSMLGL